ncbi:MAG TPA: 50S ribosomal protein L11 methyltransferase [Syntrophales bacterium]|nr:50S ribosomal protein L11 methyltransferase [Syntrophales bacterium]HPQ44874.1 50S ribosomal protein L11 methyltransferase [Syntrophales bacterium]
MPETREQWIELTILTPPEMVDALSNFLEELGTNGVFQETKVQDSFNGPAVSSVPEREEIKSYLPWSQDIDEQIIRIETYIDGISAIFPLLDKPLLSTKTITDPDWAEGWKKYFKPLRVSDNIVIKPTWERYSPSGRDIVIDIDPGMAFGTGQHASTMMCIGAIEDILLKDRYREERTVLDVGTGTGILAICSAKLGARMVTGIDIDPKAIEIAGKNIEINDVEDRVEIINEDIARYTGSFDLIVANLISGALINLHNHLVSLVRPGRYIIASGITEHDAQDVENTYCDGAMTLHDTRSDKEWVCYTFKKTDR